MTQYRFFIPAAAVLLAVALTLGACSDQASIVGPESGSEFVAPRGAPTAGHLSTVYWQGHGSEHIDGCVSGYHWIVAPAGGITSVPQFFSSIAADNDVPMFRPSGNNDPNSGAAWHYNSGLVDTEIGVTPYVTFEGDPDKVKLVISHCLDEDGQSLLVTKTADTEFVREHKWDITKRVDTENEYELEDGTPKIWLYTDGSGNEKATWTVDVTYEGYEDSGFVILGDISITNIADPPAVKTITSIVDDLGLAGYGDVLVECEDGGGAAFTNAALPRDIQPGETWLCEYRIELEEGDAEAGDSGTNTVTVTVLDDPFSPYSDTAGWEFDEPTTVLDKTVNVDDLSDLFGNVNLGSVTAPNGDTFTYDKEFAWAGYGQEECGSYRYDNTAEIVETGQEADAELAVNVQCYEFESAWAMGEGEGVVANAFCDNGFSNWGWSNLIGKPYGPASWPLYAGAAQCDPDKGMLVGHFELTYGSLTYDFVPLAGLDVLFEGEAVYADTGMFPLLRNGNATTAPGQYYVADPLNGDIHVIAHVNAGIPDPDFGP